MCLLMVAKPNAMPTDDQLMCACVNNPDGFGYAVHTGKSIITGRGMNHDDVIDRFLTVREKHINGWAMFHARFTTHGETVKENCHPFRVGGSPNTILAHNGILGNVKIPAGDKRSDTRVFAEDLLPKRLNILDSKKKFKKLEKWAAGSKVAVFTTDRRLNKAVYIINEKLGSWDDDGIWWSNSSYKPSYYTATYRSTPSKWTSSYDIAQGNNKYVLNGEDMTSFVEEGMACSYCGHFFDEPDFFHGYCQTCWVCMECQDFEESCMCYRPTYKVGQRHPYDITYDHSF
jgi:predicted glutamine amidotransferase